MKGPSGAPRVLALALLSVTAFALPGAETASAQGDPRHAVDRFEPSERGSEWLANESLDLRGQLRPSLGYVSTFAHRPLVVPAADGSPERAPVKDLVLFHLGGSLVEHGIDRARISTEGFGPARPIATNETEAGRAENRRLEFHLDP